MMLPREQQSLVACLAIHPGQVRELGLVRDSSSKGLTYKCTYETKVVF